MPTYIAQSTFQFLISCLDTPQQLRVIMQYYLSWQTELALQLCWAVGEHGGGGPSHKDAARELSETLELLQYENLASKYLRTYTSQIFQAQILC